MTETVPRGAAGDLVVKARPLRLRTRRRRRERDDGTLLPRFREHGNHLERLPLLRILTSDTAPLVVVLDWPARR
jgi:hypothetical protein